MDIITSIKTKADAMAFAIEQSRVDLGKADRIYRMFVDNMELPDTETAAADSCFKNLADATEALTRRIEARLTGNAKPELAEVADEKTPSTIILPSMPHLEWMTENLQGFGGTEVDGRWYYTYDEAVEAVKQLGNGWRLMTRGEAVDLADLGSEWQEEGPQGLPGRLFGGGLFFPAAGYRNRETGALNVVGTYGYVWSSSPYATDGTNVHCAGFLSFHAGNAGPLRWASRANGFAVRCVRNVK